MVPLHRHKFTGPGATPHYDALVSPGVPAAVAHVGPMNRVSREVTCVRF